MNYSTFLFESNDLDVSARILLFATTDEDGAPLWTSSFAIWEEDGEKFGIFADPDCLEGRFCTGGNARDLKTWASTNFFELAKEGMANRSIVRWKWPGVDNYVMEFAGAF